MHFLEQSYHDREPTKVMNAQSVAQRCLRSNSKDLWRLGLRPGYAWRDFQKDFDKLLQKDSSARTVLLVRHGEGDHNAAERRLGSEQWENVEAKSDKYFDANLNGVGLRQCEDLNKAFQLSLKSGLQVDVIIVSPLSRAIQTAKYGLASIWKKVPIYAVEMSRERFGKNICDKRKSVTTLKKEFPEVNFDFFMEGEDDTWFSPERETDEQIDQRVTYFYNWLLRAPKDWRSVVIVGHSSFMCQSIQCLGATRHWPSNCELVPFVITQKI